MADVTRDRRNNARAARPDDPPPHALAVDALAARLQTNLSDGLSSAEAARRLDHDGPNELAAAPPDPRWRRLAAQFRSLLILLLVAAAVIAAALGEWVDAAAILAIVFLNGLIGYFQEQRAQRALEALEKLAAPAAKVVRDGHLQSIAARELVAGDLIEIEAGDYVPADARLVTATGLAAQEAALTGESLPVDKSPAPRALESALGDRGNMLYLGTLLAAGKGTAVVTATGMQTELGKIAGLLERHKPEPTPLERRLAELGRLLIVVCLLIVAIIFILQLVRGGELLEVFLLAVSLAVAAVPEGLPAVVTLALAMGLVRMVRRNALIRKLPSVETLGSVTVICSDKTGTLTRNEMTVREVVCGSGRYAVSGAGYAPVGEFTCSGDGQPPRRVDPLADPDLRQALIVAGGANNAQVVQDEAGRWQVLGDPTEGALVVLSRKAGLPDAPRGGVLYEVPFDSQRKAMSVARRGDDGATMLLTKGAPEVLLSLSVAEQRGGETVPLDARRKNELAGIGAELAAQALRVLGLAFRRPAPRVPAGAETELVFAGLVGMLDPPRDEAKTAVAKCFAAGIRPVMITGDHPQTARAIALELKLAGPDDRVVSGSELEGMSAAELAEAVEQIAVYARVSAEHKLAIVEAWRARGQVVAMTGDGVNDAPAIKAADIGIAMGITGTDVTKDASDMVLVDDNFASIVAAVEEGRGIFDNIQKFVQYLLSCNAGEVLLMFFAALAGWPAPLLPVQLLWINLVTDGLPALALGMEPPEPDVMHRPPRKPRQPVVTPRRGVAIVIDGLLMAATSLAAFRLVYDGPDSLPSARAVAFTTTALAQLCFSLACRSRQRTMPQLGPFTNPYLLAAIAVSAAMQIAAVTIPWLQPVFGVRAEVDAHWPLVIALALVPVTIVEVGKLLRAAWRRLAGGTARSVRYRT